MKNKMKGENRVVQKRLKPALGQLRDRHRLVGAEIGVAYGTHASYYLKELDIECVFLIDPYIEYENYTCQAGKLKESLEAVEKIAHTKLCGYEQKIKWIKKKSAEASQLIADDSLDFVYRDGNHSYDSVVEDISLYYSKLKKGGLFSGHDYDWEGVKRAVDEFVKTCNLDLYIETTGEVRGRDTYDWWIWKKEKGKYE